MAPLVSEEFEHDGVTLVPVRELISCEGCYGEKDRAFDDLDATGCCSVLPDCGANVPPAGFALIFVRKDQMTAYVAHMLELS